MRLIKPKVRDLIKALKQLPPDFKVLLSVDEEQNATANDILIENYENEIVLLPLNPSQDF